MPPAGAAATAPAAVRFGQAVIGPPGAGKTTYCQGMAAFLRARGRACAIINLDPANDELPYAADVDVAELVKLAVSCVCCLFSPWWHDVCGIGAYLSIIYAGIYSTINQTPQIKPPSIRT